jgi:hypothetical protein
MKSVNFTPETMQKKTVKSSRKARNRADNWALIAGNSAFPMLWQKMQVQSALNTVTTDRKQSGEIPIAMPRTPSAAAKNRTNPAAGTARRQNSLPFTGTSSVNDTVLKALQAWSATAGKEGGNRIKPGSVAQVKIPEMSILPANGEAIGTQEGQSVGSKPGFAKGTSGNFHTAGQTLFFVFKGAQGWQAVNAAEGKQLAQNAPALMRMMFAPAQQSASRTAQTAGPHLTLLETENPLRAEKHKTAGKETTGKGKVSGKNNKQTIKVQVLTDKQPNEEKIAVKKSEHSANPKVPSVGSQTEQNAANNPNAQNSAAAEFSEHVFARSAVAKRATSSGAKTHGQTEMGAVIAGQAKFAGKMQGLAQGTVRHRGLIQRIQKMVMEAQGASGRPVGRIRLQLTESPFGRMDVQYDKDRDELTVVVESEKARQAFLKLVPVIQSHLNDKGILLGSFDVQINQFAAQEKQEQSNKRNNTGQANTQAGKEVHSHEIDSTVTKRNFGYNTMEVIA